MGHNNSDHLNEDQIFSAVINESSTQPDSHHHLATCDRCRTEKEQIENDLNLLGRKASLFAPSPEQKQWLASSILSRHHKKAVNRRLAFSLAAAAVLLAIVCVPAIHYLTPGNDIRTAMQAEWEIDPLMAETEALSNDALPEVYLDISANGYPVVDDEFVQSIIPPLTETDISFYQVFKGVLQC